MDGGMDGWIEVLVDEWIDVGMDQHMYRLGGWMDINICIHAVVGHNCGMRCG